MILIEIEYLLIISFITCVGIVGMHLREKECDELEEKLLKIQDKNYELRLQNSNLKGLNEALNRRIKELEERN